MVNIMMIVLYFYWFYLIAFELLYSAIAFFFYFTFMKTRHI